MSDEMKDLNGILFSQLNRLSAVNMTGEELQEEIERSKAITGVTKEIIQAGKLVLDAAKLRSEHKGFKDSYLPALLTEEK